MSDPKIQNQPCSVCGVKSGIFVEQQTMTEMDGKIYCEKHFEEKVNSLIATVIVTSTPAIEGKRITKYIDFDSVEVVMGTGFMTEFSGDFADLTGTRSGSFEEKLQKGKGAALKALRFKAIQAGGNALVGVDLDYTTFSGNKIGIIASGTIVICEYK